MRTDLAALCAGEADAAAATATGAGAVLEMDGEEETASESSSETLDALCTKKRSGVKRQQGHKWNTRSPSKSRHEQVDLRH